MVAVPLHAPLFTFSSHQIQCADWYTDPCHSFKSCRNHGHQIDGLRKRLIPLQHMPHSLSQLRQKSHSLHCCIYSKIKICMLGLYVIIRLSPRLMLFSLCFFILSFFLLIIHHSCLLKYWVAVPKATSPSKFCQCMSEVRLLFSPSVPTGLSLWFLAARIPAQGQLLPAQPLPSPAHTQRGRAGLWGALLIAEIVIPSTRYLAALSLPAQPLNVHTFKQ